MVQFRSHRSIMRSSVATAVAVGIFIGASSSASAQNRVAIGVTETIASQNPYSDSVSLMYSVWCQVYGCLFHYDFDQQSHVSYTLESWGLKDESDPLVWTFTLLPDLVRHNGEPVTTADVLHTIERIRTDPQSRQQHNVRYIEEVLAVDDRTFEIVTTEPNATLQLYLQNVIITSKALYDEFGAAADTQAPYGHGPYELVDLEVGNFVSLRKNEDHPLVSEANPDEVIFRIMPEPEQRVTALLNGEIQIAQFVPPQLVDRVDQAPNSEVAWVDSVEIMFLAMNPVVEPWDNKLVRQAVGYAINREAIINAILQGQASVLDGPVGPGQVGYRAENEPFFTYDPDRARELLAEAGYPDGLDVEYLTPVGRYTADRQISEALVSMLEDVGFRVDFQTPEWSTLWADVQSGGVPFYYMGRGSVVDPSAALSQYFETDQTPRIEFSNAEVDRLLQAERQTFDEQERLDLLDQAMRTITEEAPAHFMWRHQMAWGVSSALDYTPRPDSGIDAWTIFAR